MKTSGYSLHRSPSKVTVNIKPDVFFGDKQVSIQSLNKELYHKALMYDHGTLVSNTCYCYTKLNSTSRIWCFPFSGHNSYNTTVVCMAKLTSAVTKATLEEVYRKLMRHMLVCLIYTCTPSVSDYNTSQLITHTRMCKRGLINRFVHVCL